MSKPFGLSQELYDRFLRIQQKHYRAYGEGESKEQHSLDNIESLRYDPDKDLFYVWYHATENRQGVWYHYDTNKMVWW